MDNNELDKILKQKLSGTIEPPKELENKIKETINEQKKVARQEQTQKQPNKKRFYSKMGKFISVAAVFVVAFTFGVFYKNQDGEPIIPIPEFIEAKVEKATIKTIKPTKLTSGIVAKDSEFLIEVKEANSTVQSVQKSLYIEPALEYDISKTGDNEYKLKFKQNIPDNTILKLQYVKDKITEDSWAYQTNTDLSVTHTFPGDGSNYVSENTTIEVELSYANVENFEENVTITPEIDGTWEHLGKIWRFTPSKKIQEQTYTVVINKQISADSKNMKENYKFEFTVGDKINDYYLYSNTVSEDKIVTYSSDEQVKIFYEVSFYGADAKNLEIKNVEISKFENVDDFIEYLEDEEKNYSKATKLGKYEFDNKVTESEQYITLNKNLQVGYYVASLQNAKGKELLNCPIQINNMQTYVMESERDIIAWVADDGKLAPGVEVSFLGKTVKTNNQGIAILKDLTDGSDKMKYVKIGNDSNKLVVGANNFTHDTYPNAYLYTDRPLYKSTDTINIWGFVPRILFYDKIDENEFYITSEYDGKDKQRITIDQDGNFEYKKELVNYEDGEYYFYLLYKDEIIGGVGVQVKNYELQNYEYETILEKNYAYVGESFDFDVKVTHITGIPVPNKSVTIEYEGKTTKVKTDENGLAHVSIQTVYDGDEDYSGIRYQTISVYNGDSEEYSEAIEYIELRVISRNVNIEIQGNEKNIDITLNKLLKDKNEHIKGIEDLFDGIYDTEVDIYLEENTSTRYIDGYTYNEYTKENQPNYRWVNSENNEKPETINTNNGKYTFDTNLIQMKKSTEDVSYSYEVRFEFKDTNGQLVKEEKFIYDYSNNSDGRVGYWDYWSGYNNRYNMYRYLLKSESEYGSKHSIGDKIDLKLNESTIDGLKEIKNEGKVLRIISQEDITKTDIIENDDLSYTFANEDFPGTNITAAYFLNGKFYRMPSINFDFNEEDRKVDIEVISDKEQYKPGDKVTLTVKTTNNNKPIKTSVNISVANEAVFKIVEEGEYDLLSTIYNSKYYPIYTYSSFYDELGTNGGGRRRRRRRRRSKK